MGCVYFCFLLQPCLYISLKTTSIAIPTGSGALLFSPGDKVPCDNRWPLLACHFPSPVYLLPCYNAWVNAICTQGHKCCFLCTYLHQCHYVICSDDTRNYLSTLHFPLWLSNAWFSIVSTFIIYDICLSFFCDPSSSATGSHHHVNDLPNKRFLVIFHLTFSIIQITAKAWILPQTPPSCEIPPILFPSLLSKMKILVTSWLSMFPPYSLREASWKQTTWA